MKNMVAKTMAVLMAAGAAAFGGCASLGGGGAQIDRVFVGNQVSENAHAMKVESSETGVNIENWRHAIDGGYFQYTMKTGGNANIAVRVHYWAHEAGERTFNIIVDDTVIATENVVGKFRNEKNPQEFYDVDYPVPPELVQGKNSVVVRFQGVDEYQIAGGVYGLTLVKLDDGN
jgi:hypothetical protein